MFSLKQGDTVDVGWYDNLTVLDVTDDQVLCSLDGYDKDSELFDLKEVDGWSNGVYCAHKTSSETWMFYREIGVDAKDVVEAMNKANEEWV